MSNIFFKYGNKSTAFFFIAYVEILGPYTFIIKFTERLDINKFIP